MDALGDDALASILGAAPDPRTVAAAAAASSTLARVARDRHDAWAGAAAGRWGVVAAPGLPTPSRDVCRTHAGLAPGAPWWGLDLTWPADVVTGLGLIDVAAWTGERGQPGRRPGGGRVPPAPPLPSLLAAVASEAGIDLWPVPGAPPPPGAVACGRPPPPPPPPRLRGRGRGLPRRLHAHPHPGLLRRRRRALRAGPPPGGGAGGRQRGPVPGPPLGAGGGRAPAPTPPPGSAAGLAGGGDGW